MAPSTKKQTAVRLDEFILDGLQEVKDREGIPISEQVRRAVLVWLESKGVIQKKPAPRKRR